MAKAIVANRWGSMDGNLCANASTSGENDIPSPPYKDHLSSSDDLVTTYEATRAGFVALALIVVLRLTLPKPGHYRQPYQKPELLLIC